jgi:carbamoyltransferase
MNILGISGSTHDSSASLIINGNIFMAVEEERITRLKHARGQKPIHAIETILKRANLRPEEIDLVSYFLDPKLYNRQALGHVLVGDPGRYLLHPRSYRTTKFLKRGNRYENDLLELLTFLKIKAPVEYVPHHLAHAASAFFLSDFDSAMILILDNMGELASTSLLVGNDTELKMLKSQNIPHSLGMFYSAITEYLGFTPWDEEGKVMALSSYGNQILPLDHIVKIKNGEFRINRDFQMVETIGHDRCYSKKLIKRFGPSRKKDGEINQRHRDISASIQNATEAVSKELVKYINKETKLNKLCVAGGVALNCKMNGELYKLDFVEDIYVPPAPGDNGASLGAAIYSMVLREKKRPKPLIKAGIGPAFSNDEIKKRLELDGISYIKLNNPAKTAAELLLKEKVIAWYQGELEFGPRALGHRSILALPNSINLRDYINKEVKNRELWRPLCPSITATHVNEYFHISNNARFMNIAVESTDYAKKRIPGVIHIDGTARIQVVYQEESEVFFDLLNIIGNETGDPILLNTSFNRKGEPIVSTPRDALFCFEAMPIKTMVMGDYLIQKRNEKR